jgi:hypothetical protein
MANVQKSDGVDSAMAGMLAGMKLNAEDSLRVWSEACDLYAAYFNAITHAKGVEGVVAANGDLASGSMALMLHSAARKKGVDGAHHS